MRVIAGKYKGRKLAAPAGRDIRPTTDKTKEAIFSILAFDLPGARVLDLFSGTGALGIEALSRGASSCIFCERSKTALKQIEENLEHCGIRQSRTIPAQAADEADDAVAVIRPGDVMNSLEMLEGPFDVILMDPPYGQGFCEEALRLISERKLLSEDGLIVCEHRKEDELPEKAGDLGRIKERRYGISMLSIYEVDQVRRTQ